MPPRRNTLAEEMRARAAAAAETRRQAAANEAVSGSAPVQPPINPLSYQAATAAQSGNPPPYLTPTAPAPSVAQSTSFQAQQASIGASGSGQIDPTALPRSRSSQPYAAPASQNQRESVDRSRPQSQSRGRTTQPAATASTSAVVATTSTSRTEQPATRWPDVPYRAERLNIASASRSRFASPYQQFLARNPQLQNPLGISYGEARCRAAARIELFMSEIHGLFPCHDPYGRPIPDQMNLLEGYHQDAVLREEHGLPLRQASFQM